MTTIDRDDPRLTAYALGELDDDAERAAFEQLLASDPEAQAEVDAIRAFGGELATEMTQAAPPALTDAQRAEIARACAPIARAKTRGWLRPALTYAVAAGLLGVGGAQVFLALEPRGSVFGELAADERGAAVDAVKARLIAQGGLESAGTQLKTYALGEEVVLGTVVDGRLQLTATRNVEHELQFEEWSGTSTVTVSPTLGSSSGNHLATPWAPADGRDGSSDQDQAAMRVRMLWDLAERQRELEDEREFRLEQARLESQVGRAYGRVEELTPERQRAEILAMRRERNALYAARLKEVEASGLSEAEKRQAVDRIVYDWGRGTSETQGLVGEIDRVPAETPERVAAETKQYRDALGLGDDGWASLPSAERLERVQRALADGTGVLGSLITETPANPEPDASRVQQPLPPVQDNAFKPTKAEPQSTFSIDVDTASYAAVRQALVQRNALPPHAAVRIEELVNYFSYDYAGPTDEHPFATHVEVAGCPWTPGHQLVRVALKGKELQADRRPASNLVFLIDVSGSMSAENKLPLVKRSLGLLIDQLRPTDKVSMVVYAGASGLVLEPTPGDRKQELHAALDRLAAGGSTNGGAGIQLAYDVASRHFAEGGVNRVVLCTDGDWNVGAQSEAELQALIERKAKSKVFLSVLGFGMDHADRKLELLADKGNGNYAFVDTLAEARKVLVDQLAGTLCTIAKDVKVQVEWNPAAVRSYRLIGYENRVLANRDFADDAKDAGEIGAGHTVTALYEVEPTGEQAESAPLMTLRLRYKPPEGDVSQLIERAVQVDDRSFDGASTDLRFAAAVASYGMILRDSPHRGASTLALVEEVAASSRGADVHGHRAEFVELVKLTRRLTGR